MQNLFCRPFGQRGKLRLRKGEEPAQGHTGTRPRSFGFSLIYALLPKHHRGCGFSAVSSGLTTLSLPQGPKATEEGVAWERGRPLFCGPDPTQGPIVSGTQGAASQAAALHSWAQGALGRPVPGRPPPVAAGGGLESQPGCGAAHSLLTPKASEHVGCI